MKFYFAPMEGITGYIHRNAFRAYFSPEEKECIEKYFIPFINPNQKGILNAREQNDILPEHNEGIYAVPQILTNKSEDFVRTAKVLEDYGYREVNLNLGCPSRTVVAKRRGAGFLSETEALDRFLEEIFSQLNMKISVKTRIGKDAPEEWFTLMKIYNQYPMEELIIHPRIQTDMYKNKPNLEVFQEALAISCNPVCYNGDLFTEADYKRFADRFSQIDRVMFGRGLLTNPGLARKIRYGIPLEKKSLKAFHDRIYEDYQEVLFGEKTVLFKMKELWFYMGDMFEDSAKFVKSIRKAQRLNSYEAAVEELFVKRELEEEKRI